MTTSSVVTILTVSFNSAKFVQEYFSSLFAVEDYGLDLEVIMVDNGSSDNTLALTSAHFPQVNVIKNDINNYARALNKGISIATGDYIAISNNDARLHPKWLIELLKMVKSNENVGAAQSKILFADGKTINSTGVSEIEQFYFEDIGYQEPDTGQFKKPKEVEYITGGSVLFKRDCLEDVGPWDEDFIMYLEDVDYSYRCRKKGWQLWYAPESIMYHHYHGSASHELCEYLCSRNRFFFIAKHQPEYMSQSITSSHFYKKGQYDLLSQTLLDATRKLCSIHQETVIKDTLESLKNSLVKCVGEVSAHNFFSQLELKLGLRKIRIGIYDHAFHFAGGGQRYVAELAAIMQDRFDVTYIANKDVTLDKYKEWFNIDLSGCTLKVIKIPFFEKRNRYIPDEGMVLSEPYNVFDIISEESLSYDIFINANMLSKVNPLSPLSLFICHFPDQEIAPFFQVDKYNYLIVNGEYTGNWVKKRWRLTPSHKLYPPVNMYNSNSSAQAKKQIILSVSRFEQSGSKKQFEMIQAFSEMVEQHPKLLQNWKLVLAGGSIPDNHYLEMIKSTVNNANCNIEVIANASLATISTLYKQAALFWHACGLEESRPERVEHFGMTTVESMQNYCVPIVIDGGGQKEIVDHKKNGYRFSNLAELQEYTLQCITDDRLRMKLAANAYEKSHLFNYQVFKQQTEQLLDMLETQLLGQDILLTNEVQQKTCTNLQ